MPRLPLLREQSNEWSLDGELAEDLPAGEKQQQRACEHKRPPAQRGADEGVRSGSAEWIDK
jgi:hypothetical protein